MQAHRKGSIFLTVTGIPSCDLWLEMDLSKAKDRSDLCPRLTRAQTLTVSFTKPWNSLAETVVATRDSFDFSATCSRWWWLLDVARTFFDENPIS